MPRSTRPKSPGAHQPATAKVSHASPSPHHASAIPAPSLALLALELRAFWEFGAVLPAWPALMRAPRGDGHSVIVYPGLATGDISTYALRRYLQTLGYEVSGWEQGSNFGPRAGVLEKAIEQVQQTYERSGRPVSLVGWSLGGVYARELAKEMPKKVRCVITMGSPFAGNPRSTNAWRLYELVSGRQSERETQHFDLAKAPSVPTTSVFSKTDGVVAWQGSIQSPVAQNPHIENIQVQSSHFGIGLNPSAWWAVADRLAQPPGDWQPFKTPSLLGLERLVFPSS